MAKVRPKARVLKYCCGSCEHIHKPYLRINGQQRCPKCGGTSLPYKIKLKGQPEIVTPRYFQANVEDCTLTMHSPDKITPKLLPDTVILPDTPVYIKNSFQPEKYSESRDYEIHCNFEGIDNGWFVHSSPDGNLYVTKKQGEPLK